MACIRPIAVPVNSKRIYVNYRQKLINYVPCGHCYECRKEKTMQLMVRAYYDTAECVLFDTLSYRESKITWLKDEMENLVSNKYVLDGKNIRVLNYEDYQKFMKRLRKELNKKYPEVSIKYIVSAEYGHDDNYIDDKGRKRKGTNRPHFHIIFFIHGDIDVCELSQMIHDKWNNGMTDGWQDKGMQYFKNKRVFKGYEAKYNVIGYLCKYVTKTNKYEKEIRFHIDNYLRQIEEKLFKTKDDITIKEIRTKINKKYLQFVKWSKGFGEEFITEDNIKKYESKLYLQLRTDLKNKKYNLPLYYRRKIYQDYEIIGDYYYLNERGKKLLSKKLNAEYHNNINKLILAGYKNEIENIAYYWTYVKDRKDGDIIPNEKDYFYWNENSNKDRQIYKDGKIDLDGRILSTKEYIKKSVKNIEEYDKIIADTIKKICDENSKIADIKEKNEEIKKNIKKI